MIIRSLSLFICIFMFFTSCSLFSPGIDLITKTLQVTIGMDGSIEQFVNPENGVDYLSKEEKCSLMSIRVNNEILNPQSLKYSKTDDLLILSFKNGLEAKLKAETKDTHVTFELIEISDPEKIELIIWGPFPTVINEIIGETVGVVQGIDYAMGIQALNPKTLGGYPWQENDCMPQIDIFDQEDLSDLSEKGKRYVLYRVEAAKPTDYGSSLQAYCRNRNKERIIENWNHEKYVAPDFEDGGIIGSKIALFGCPISSVLETIGEIEKQESLPHPMIDNEWGKVSRTASAAYLIMGFGEKDIQKSLNICKKAGLRYLYHPGPFENWGHFDLNKKQFPNGINSMKSCVEKAEGENVILGLHTLSNFITTNDPYVTPLPDKRLAKVGSSTITEDIDQKQTEIPIKSPDFFNQFKNNHLKTVVINNELIRYGAVSEFAPWYLLDCQRGSYKTNATSHSKGAEISKLADHAYKVFLTNAELSIEVSKNIADLYNKTGLRQISFDGLEGNRSTGMGNYGEILFTQAWYDNLSEEIKRHYIADASRTTHFFWHMYTRMNWGEPWYAGFRESQTEYRLKNQKYFKRNLMPAMLGWFKMTPETSIEDIEWMLARSAAFNAGYAFVTSYETLEQNQNADEILKLLGMWEKVRLAGVFSQDQRQRMEDIKNEFHLEAVSDAEYKLSQIHTYKFRHEKKVRQPGEPLYSTFNFENPTQEQRIGFILTAVDGGIKDIKIEIDNYKQVYIPVHLKSGETLKYSGGNKVMIYNNHWRKLKEINIDASSFNLSKGSHSLTYDCKFTSGQTPYAKLELRIFEPPETITLK